MKIIIKLILIVLLVSCNSSLEKWKSYDESEEILKNSSSTQDIQSALNFLIKTKSVTGHVSLLDGGAHLSPPARDVAFN